MRAFKAYCNALGFLMIGFAIILSNLPFYSQYFLIGVMFFIWERKADYDLSKEPERPFSLGMIDPIPEVERKVKKENRTEALYRIIQPSEEGSKQ